MEKLATDIYTFDNLVKFGFTYIDKTMELSCATFEDGRMASTNALYDGEPEKFVAALKRLFSNIPYDLTDRQNEQMWQTIVYVILRMVGVDVGGEVRTNEGRIDMTAETPDHCYVIEFKLDKSAAEAIAQIKANRYADRFAGNGKTLTLIGLAFSKERRTIVDSAMEKA